MTFSVPCFPVHGVDRMVTYLTIIMCILWPALDPWDAEVALLLF